MSKAFVCILLDIPDPDAVVDVVKAIDPPNIPHFAGNVAFVVEEPYVTELHKWLKEK